MKMCVLTCFFSAYQWEIEKSESGRVAMRRMLQMVPRVLHQLPDGEARPVHAQLHLHLQELFADRVGAIQEDASS
jgi:hypothetical protein